MEHMLRQCLIALRLSERMGLDKSDRDVVYYTSLLAWVGCNVDAYEHAKWFGDEFVLKADSRLVDFTGPVPAMQFVFGHLGSGKPGLERIRLAMAFLAGGHRDGEVMLENHWRAADDLMAGLELPQPVRDSVQQTYARWDGNGVPPGLGGEDILITSRLVNLAPRSSSRIAARRACETRRPLRTGARSTKMTGIAELAVTRSVTASARRVLPKPPTPSNVTRRELATSRSTSTQSCSRPIKFVSGVGKDADWTV
jgi:hypothetical protein